MKLLAKPPSGPVNELINIYMGILGEASVKCKTASDGMKQSCDEWNNFLQLFHKVVKSKKGNREYPIDKTEVNLI